MSLREERVTLSHGAGGTMMARLIDELFLEAYGDATAARDDSAVVDLSGPLAFTTDSFVVDPLFFPGGDIGRLAIAGTVNDLLTAAAQPLVISASFIIEEGFAISDLRSIACAMAETADECGVRIVTGDTKVVPRGSADRLFVTTSGIGRVLRPGVSGACARPGDVIILTGSVGDHGAAVMLARENLLETDNIRSDIAPLTEIVMNLLDAGCEIHAMRDPTRGGIGSALNEIARQSGTAIHIDECAVVVKPAVAAACEALGIDPLYVANEGKMLIVADPADAQRALEVVRASRYGEDAALIGEVRTGPPGRVQVRTSIGTSRILSPPSGELLPRIC
ncbi:MAG: hydrogenase expression/formation protein HypE [Armatimonadota bacterium]